MADSPAPGVRAHRPGPTRPYARLAVTLGAVGVTLGLARIPLAGASAPVPGDPGQPTSILALGLTPILAAFVVVEISALLVPGWRALRIRGFAGRRQLGRLALLLALPLTAVQTLGSVRALQTLGRLPAKAGPELVVGITLAAAPFLLLALASAVSRFGLGEGMSVIVGSLLFAETVPVLAHLGARLHAGKLSVEDLLLLAGVEAVVGLDTAWTLHRRARRPAEGGEATLPLPASGVVPLQILAWAAALLPSVALFLPALQPLAGRLMHASRPEQLGLLVLLVALGALLAWAFNRPVLVGGFLARARGIPEHRDALVATARRLLLEGTAHTLVFLVLVEVAFFFVGGISPAMGLLGAVWIVVLVAVGLDVAEDWRFRARHGSLAAVWPMHRVYAVPPVLEAMTTAGIPCLARGTAHRSLLQLVGPYVPMTLLVPEPLATDATEVMDLVVGDAGARLSR